MDKSTVQDNKLEPRGAKLKRYMEETMTMRELLPPHMAWANFKSVVFGAFKKNPKLLQCNYDTILKSVMEAATAGLEVNTVLGEASLVPFKNECKLMIEWRGLAKMAWASGYIARVDHGVIRENDKYKYVDGIDQVFSIERDLRMTEDERGEIIAFYAMAQIKDGGYSVVVMTVDEVTKHGQRYSKSFSNTDSMWQKHFEGAGIKTCYRVLYDKKIPKATFDDKIREVLANQFSFEHEKADFSRISETEEADFEVTTGTDVEQPPVEAKEEPKNTQEDSGGNTAENQEKAVEEESDNMFEKPTSPAGIEDFIPRVNKLAVTISKANGDPYTEIERIAGTTVIKEIHDIKIQEKVLIELQKIIDNPDEMPVVLDYVKQFNELADKIEELGGDWKTIVIAFTGKAEIDDELSSPTKQNILNRLQSEIEDLTESKGQ